MKTIDPFMLFFFLSPFCMSTMTETGKKIIDYQVVTMDQKPIEGAEAELLWPYQKPEGLEKMDKGCMRTVTNKKGWFRFEVADYIHRDSYYITLVRKEGFSLGWKYIYANEDPIILYPLSRFSARVVDIRGKPVPEAKVELLEVFLKTSQFGKYDMGQMLKSSDVLPFMSARTKEDGRFQFDSFSQGTRLQMCISKEGYAAFYSYQVSDELSYPEGKFLNPITGKIHKDPYRKPIGPEYNVGSAEVEIVLKPQSIIQGIVIDSKSRKPLPAMPLFLFLDGGSGYPVTYHPQIACTTDAEGKFNFSGLERGTYALSFEEAGHSYATDMLEINLSEGQKRDDVVFELTQGGKLHLELVDSADRRPVGKCQIYIEGSKTLRFAMMYTDDQGLLVQNMLPGTYKINGFFKKGYGRIPRQHLFDIKEGQTTSLSLELEEEPRVTVSVKDPDGKPVRDCKVWFLRSKKDDYPEIDYWQTDTDSGFTLWSKSPAKEGEIIAEVIDYKKNLVGIFPLAIPGKEVSVTLTKGMKLMGTVQDQDQNPLPNLHFRLFCRYQKQDMAIDYSVSRYRTDTSWTDSKGQFAIYGIPPAESIRYMSLNISMGGNEVMTPIDPNQAVNNVITLTHRIHYIQVKAVDDAGNPVSDALIMAIIGTDMTAGGTTDSQGRFAMILSKWPVVISAVKGMEDKRKLIGSVKIADDKSEVTIIMKQPPP